MSCEGEEYVGTKVVGTGDRGAEVERTEVVRASIICGKQGTNGSMGKLQQNQTERKQVANRRWSEGLMEEIRDIGQRRS